MRAGAEEPGRRPSPATGVDVRRLDHVNFLAADVAAERRLLRRRARRAGPPSRSCSTTGRIAAQWLTFSNKSYDLVYTEDWTGSHGRLHHIAFATDTREDILRAADVFLDNGVHIETGPHKHAIQQTFFLYVCEPGGNRIELCNAGARLILAPDWDVITWTAGRARQGSGVGTEDHRDLPHPRHPTRSGYTLRHGTHRRKGPI